MECAECLYHWRKLGDRTLEPLRFSDRQPTTLPLPAYLPKQISRPLYRPLCHASAKTAKYTTATPRIGGRAPASARPDFQSPGVALEKCHGLDDARSAGTCWRSPPRRADSLLVHQHRGVARQGRRVARHTRSAMARVTGRSPSPPRSRPRAADRSTACQAGRGAARLSSVVSNRFAAWNSQRAASHFARRVGMGALDQGLAALHTYPRRRARDQRLKFPSPQNRSAIRSRARVEQSCIERRISSRLMSAFLPG